MHQTNFAKRATLRLAIACSALAFVTTAAMAQTSPGVTDKEIRLGTWMPLTGPVAAYGVPWRIGIETYLNMVNDQGGVKGHKLVLVVEDNGYNPQRTVAAARKLVSRDNVLAIASPFGTGQSAAAFDYLFDEAKVPLINPFGGAADWYATAKPYLFGALVLYENQLRTLGRWAAKDGHKSIVVVHSAGAVYDNLVANVVPGAKSVKADIKTEMFPTKLGTTDYAPIALELAKKNPDAIIFVLTETELVAAAKELRAQGYKGAIYSNVAAVSNSILELGGAAIDGLKATSYAIPVSSDVPAVKEYRDALAKYAPGEKPDYLSMIGFALTKINVEAIRRIDGPVTRQGLLNSLNAMRNYDTGIVPPVSYSPERHLGASLLQRVMVQGGRWVAVGTGVESDKDWQ